ncbi:hypothetical protein FSP39_021901 [Pinctada imbricata]|uniref:G-protein coupled receptors family 1 profile domain-containing protein n=1 Tax=Pinctada imbricata TaxID=66713 RepID=A0AA89BTI7_PINIB|nr:hypothetical protein FSP39_021901 [Pinctada imbricata]
MAATEGMNTTSVTEVSQEHEENTTGIADIERYVGIINGYVVPAIALLVLMTNAVVVAVFKRQKTYGASQAGLVGVAVSDTMTMLFPAPFYFYQFALGYKPSCEILEITAWISLYLPTITHTASIWLTVVLAAQRYLYVCHPFKARSMCTLKNTTIIIVVTYVIAFLFHLSRFFVMVKSFDGNECTLVYRQGIDSELYLKTYLTIRIIFIQFVPCICLIVLNTIMLLGLRSITNKKAELQNNPDNNQTVCKENTRVTIMIICMAAITLLVELPGGITISLHAANYYLGYEVADSDHLMGAEIIINLLIMFSYPLNFLLYCSMSGEFKQTLSSMFPFSKSTCCKGQEIERKQYRNRKIQANGNIQEEEMTLMTHAAGATKV